MSGFWKTANRFVYRRILHADDTPHRIALGVALATFIGFTPTMGFQTVIALGLATLMRANKVVCIPFVWVTNPLTFAPIYGFCWWLGALIVPGSSEIGFDKINQRMSLAAGGNGLLGNLFSYDFWAGALHLMLEMGSALWVGCIVVGLFFGVLLYFLTLWFIVTYRTRRRERKMVRHEARRKRGKRRDFLQAAGKSQ